MPPFIHSKIYSLFSLIIVDICTNIQMYLGKSVFVSCMHVTSGVATWHWIINERAHPCEKLILSQQFLMPIVFCLGVELYDMSFIPF